MLSSLSEGVLVQGKSRNSSAIRAEFGAQQGLVSFWPLGPVPLRPQCRGPAIGVGMLLKSSGHSSTLAGEPVF
jgi:hypothetical protein